MHKSTIKLITKSMSCNTQVREIILILHISLEEYESPYVFINVNLVCIDIVKLTDAANSLLVNSIHGGKLHLETEECFIKNWVQNMGDKGNAKCKQKTMETCKQEYHFCEIHILICVLCTKPYPDHAA